MLATKWGCCKEDKKDKKDNKFNHKKDGGINKKVNNTGNEAEPIAISKPEATAINKQIIIAGRGATVVSTPIQVPTAVTAANTALTGVQAQAQAAGASTGDVAEDSKVECCDGPDLSCLG